MNPDLILLAGDIIEDYAIAAEHNDYGKELMKLKSKWGVFGVLGNHEYYDEAEKSREYLKQHNCYIMRDEVTVVNDNIVIIGRDDRSCVTRGRPHRAQITKLLEGIDANKLIIVIDH